MLRSRLTGLVLAATVLLAVPATAGAVTNAYPFPGGNIFDGKLTLTSTGLWWSNQIGDDLWRFQPGTSTAPTHFADGGQGSYPQGLSEGPGGKVFFGIWNGGGTMPGLAEGLESVDPATQTVTTVHQHSTLPLSDRVARDIAAGHDGSMWMLQSNSSAGFVERYSSDTVTAFGAADSSAQLAFGIPYQGAVAADGSLWFGEYDLGGAQPSAIGHVAAGGVGILSETPTEAGAFPLSVAIDGSNRVWFTEMGKDYVSWIDPATLAMHRFAVPAVGLATQQKPQYVAVAPDGSIWFTTQAGYGAGHNANDNAVGRLVPQADGTAAITMFPIPNTTEQPAGITVDASGNVWFLTGAGLYEMVGAAGAGTVTPPTTPGTTPAPTTPTSPAAPAPVTVVVAPIGVVHPSTPHVAPDGGSMTERLMCVGPPQDVCTVVFDLDTQEVYSNRGNLLSGLLPGIINTVHGKAKSKTKVVRIGRVTVKLHGGQAQTVTVKLTAHGKSLLKRFKKVPTTLSVFQSTTGTQTKLVKRTKVTFTAQRKTTKH